MLFVGQFGSVLFLKLEAFEAKISENQKTVAENQMSKIQTNILAYDGYSFKRKSCEDQYNFNAKVLDKLQDAEVLLEQNSDGAGAREKVSEDKTIFSISIPTFFGLKIIRTFMGCVN